MPCGVVVARNSLKVEVRVRFDGRATNKYLNEHDLKDKYKFEIVCPKNIKQKIDLKNIKIKQIGNFKGHLWEQIDLPLYVKDKFLFNWAEFNF